MEASSFATQIATKEAKKTSSFLRYIHNFRGVAILLVVLHHASSYVPLHGEKVFSNFSLMVFGNGTISFVFIAGFLFQYLSKKYEYRKYLMTKFRNVIIPYLIVSIPAIFVCLRHQRPNTSVWFTELFPALPIPVQVTGLYLTGAHLFSFWFIPMISIFYIISPALLWLDKQAKGYWILLSLIPLSLIVPRPVDFDILQSFIHFLPVFVLGMFCSKHKDWIIPKCEKYLLPLIGVSLLLFTWEAYQRSLFLEIYEYSLPINTLNKEIICFIIIFTLWKFDAKLPVLTHRFLGYLADLSFGIYFLHGYLLHFPIWRLNSYLVLTGIDHYPIFIFFLHSFLAVLGSVLLIIPVKKILNKNSRYIVGC